MREVRTTWGLVGATAAVLAAIPLLGLGAEWTLLVCLILIYGVFATGFDLAFGLTGLLSFGHAAMFGVGGYALALLTTRLQLPFEVALLLAGVSGGVVAAVLGALSLRQRGIFFALTTLAVAQLLYILAGTKLRGLTGGVDGLSGVPRPALFGTDFYDDRNYYIYVAVLFTVLLGAAALLRLSPLGQVLRGIRLNETRIEQLGWRVRGFQYCAFVVSGFYAGVAGGLLAGLIFYVSPQTLNWNTSGEVLIVTLLGGVGTLLGPLVGVAVFELLKDELGRLTPHWYGILGVIFVLATILMPHGVVGVFSSLRGRRAK